MIRTQAFNRCRYWSLWHGMSGGLGTRFSALAACPSDDQSSGGADCLPPAPAAVSFAFAVRLEPVVKRPFDVRGRKRVRKRRAKVGAFAVEGTMPRRNRLPVVEAGVFPRNR